MPDGLSSAEDLSGLEAETWSVVAASDAEIPLAGFEQTELCDSREVKEFIDANIPAEHVEGLRGIAYVDDLWAEMIGLQGMWTQDAWGDNEINIYPHSDIEELQWSLTHEIGHNAQDAIMGWESELSQRWVGLSEQSSEYVSSYAETSPEEDFAECYAAYVNDPELLQKVGPEKYDFMKEVIFDGREY